MTDLYVSRETFGGDPVISTRLNPRVSTGSTAGGTSFAGRWRVALRYGWRDVVRNKARTTLVGLMIILPIAVATFAAIAFSDPSPRSIGHSNLGPHLAAIVNQASSNPIKQNLIGNQFEITGEASDIEPKSATQLKADIQNIIPPGLTITPALSTQSYIQFGTVINSGMVLQTDLDVPEIAATFPLRVGTLPGEGEIALSDDTARLTGAQVGDTVSLQVNQNYDQPPLTTNLRVSGIREPNPFWWYSIISADGPLQSPNSFPPPDGNAVIYRWFISGNEPVTWENVREANQLGFQVLSRAVLDGPNPPAAEVRPDDISRQPGWWQAVVAALAAIILEVALLIGPAFTISAQRAQRSLALIAANGGDKKTLSAVILAMGVVTGLIASAAGVALGIFGALILRSQRPEFLLNFNPIYLFGIFSFGLFATILAAWLPAHSASKLDVKTALAGRPPESAARKWPGVVGAAFALLGLVTLIASGLIGNALLITVGIIIAVIGLVLGAGPLVKVVGRLAAYLPLAPRFALRDAVRHQARTGAAVAAVLVATAGATAAMIYTLSNQRHLDNTATVYGVYGLLGIGPNGRDAILTPPQVAQVRSIVADIDPTIELHQVLVARTGVAAGLPDAGEWTPRELIGPETVHGANRAWSSFVGLGRGAIIDDGSLVDLYGLPDPAAARAALAAGRVLVSPWELGDDGTATFNLDGETLTLPATGIGDITGPGYSGLPIIPPLAAAEHNLPTSIGALLALPSTPLTAAQMAELTERLNNELGRVPDWPGCAVCANVVQPRQPQSTQTIETAIILGGPILIAIASAWIAAALAATESKPDLATMSAVGAAPATLKKFVAAGAGTIAVLGALLGVLAGLAVGISFVLYQRFRDPRGTDLTWVVAVPWPLILALLVAIPLIALAGAYLATRPKETLVRRAG